MAFAAACSGCGLSVVFVDLGELLFLPFAYITESDVVLVAHGVEVVADLHVSGDAAEKIVLFFGGILEGIESLLLAAEVPGAEIFSFLQFSFSHET